MEQRSGETRRDGAKQRKASRTRTLRASPPARPEIEIAAHAMIVAAAGDAASHESEIRVLTALTRALGEGGATVTMSVKRLAERAGTSQRTAQGALARLERRGKIRRTSCGHREVARTTLIALEEACRARHAVGGPAGGAAPTRREQGARARDAYETRKRLHAICADETLAMRAVRIAALASADAGGCTRQTLLERAGADTRAGQRTLKALAERGHLEVVEDRVRVARVGGGCAREEVGHCTRIENPEKDLRDRDEEGSFKDSGLNRWHATADTHEDARAKRAADDRTQRPHATHESAQASARHKQAQGARATWPEEVRHLPIERLGLNRAELEALRDPLGAGAEAQAQACEEALIERLRTSAKGRCARALIESIVSVLEKALGAEADIERVVERLRAALAERALEERREKARARRQGAIERARRAWGEFKMRTAGLTEAPRKPGQRTPTWWRPERWPMRADSRSTEQIVRTRGRTVLERRRRTLPKAPEAYHAVYEGVLKAMRRTAENLTMHRGDAVVENAVIVGWADETICEALERERVQ